MQGRPPRMPVGLPGDSLPVHFIFGLSDDPHERRFGFSHYLAVRAASIHLRPARLLFHHHHKPRGAGGLFASPAGQCDAGQ